MRVAFLRNRYPTPSEGFIDDQIAGVIARGVDAEVLAERPRGAGRALAAAPAFPPERIHYRPARPANCLLRIARGAGLIAVRREHATRLARTLDIRRFGGIAFSGKLLYTAVPFADRPEYQVVHAQFGALGLAAVLLQDASVLEGRIVTAFRGHDLGAALAPEAASTYQRLFVGCDLLLPVCDYFCARLMELGCDPARIRVHRSGIDPRRFPFSPRRLPGGEPIRFLSVGRIVEKKGFEYAIRALSRLPSSVRWEYRIAGDGPLRPALESLASKLGVANRVHFLGWQPREQIARTLYEVDILLAPSVTAVDGDMEGIPNAIKEAMAAGVPVIASRHAGIPELVADGETGLLAPERNAASLESAIRRLLDTPALWGDLAEAARQKVEAEYDIEKLTDELVTVYHGLVAGGGVPAPDSGKAKTAEIGQPWNG